MTTTPTSEDHLFHAPDVQPVPGSIAHANRYQEHQTLEAFLNSAMSYLFPVITATNPTASTRQFNQTPARHPSRYRITFTLARLPAQSLFFDEFPAFHRSPPRPREITASIALAHNANCPFPNIARLISTAHIATFGTTTPTTTCLIKACPHCIAMNPDVDATYPNDSYAEFTQTTNTTWLPVQVLPAQPTYYVLPPPPCPLPHTPTCTHNHCPDANNCICATTATAQPAACQHQHCNDAAHCTCTQQCSSPADHLISDPQPHRNCMAPHCDNPAVHLNPNIGAPVPDPRPDPTTVVPPQPRYTAQQIAASFWLRGSFEWFTRSEHAATYANSCSQLLTHIRAYIPQIRPVTPLLPHNSLSFPATEHANRGLITPIYSVHSDELIGDANQILTHPCVFIVCPLRMLVQMQTGSHTIGSTNLRTLFDTFNTQLLMSLVS
jgi:hypothetical protein